MSLLLYQKENKTPEKLVRSGGEFLKKYGIDNPLKNAEILLSNVLKEEVFKLYLSQKKVSPQKAEKYFDFLKKRAQKIPIQYITKKVDFFKYQFYIEEGVFIPRPETEILIEKTVEIYNKFFSPFKVNILDIGSGCGNIAITLALEIKECNIVATDISEKAIEISEKNASTYRVKDKVRFINADLFPEEKIKFDIIVSNPPYITEEEMGELQPEVKREPEIALNGGKNGMEIISRIFDKCSEYLKKKGYVIIEFGYNQGKYIRKIENKNFKLIEIRKDYSNTERVAIFKKIL